MSKQGEIREGIARIEMGWSPDAVSDSVKPDDVGYLSADFILSYLHSQGAVIKVKKKPELNFPKQFYKMDDSMYYETIAVEPLIEEE